MKCTYTELSNSNPIFRLIARLTRRYSQLDYMRNMDEAQQHLKTIHEEMDKCQYYITKFRARLDIDQIILRFETKECRDWLNLRGKTRRELLNSYGIPVKLPPRKKRTQRGLSPAAPAAINKVYRAIQKRQSQNGITSQHIQRACDEIRLAHQKGHYVIFLTLTADDWHFNDVFGEKSPAWQDFLTDITQLVGRNTPGFIHTEGRLKGKVNKTKCKDERRNLVRYLTVAEHGDLNDRLHLHAILICRSLPYGSMDPNGILENPVQREIDAIKPLWKYGTANPIAVRYGLSDAYSQLGWKWPVDKKTNQPIEAVNPNAIAFYVNRYLHTGETSCRTNQTDFIGQTKTKIFRVRATHGFGQEWIRERADPLPTHTCRLYLMESPCRRPSSKGNYVSKRRKNKEILFILNKRNDLNNDFLASERQTDSKILHSAKAGKKLLKDQESTRTNSGTSSQTVPDPFKNDTPETIALELERFFGGFTFKNSRLHILQEVIDDAIAVVDETIGTLDVFDSLIAGSHKRTK